jgi:chitin synthase
MALDGDVDFSPEALQLLIDRMKKNPKVGATCGRIKPGGSGNTAIIICIHIYSRFL